MAPRQRRSSASLTGTPKLGSCDTRCFYGLIELGGPVTTKGKAHALFSSYLQALDRETRLAQTLGLQRKAKSVTLADAINDAEPGH